MLKGSDASKDMPLQDTKFGCTRAVVLATYIVVTGLDDVLWEFKAATPACLTLDAICGVFTGLAHQKRSISRAPER